MPDRSPTEIRASIEQNRQALVRSVDSAHNEIARLTDWRGHIAAHRQELTVGAAVVGFAVGSALVLRAMRRRR